MTPQDDKTRLDVSATPRVCELLPGSRLGDYEVERLLGAGAMGEVYLARHKRLGMRCALKILPTEFSQSEDFQNRFEGEGRALAMLDHPHIVRILNAGEEAGLHYLAMEYVEGGSLEDRLEAAPGGRLAHEEVCRIVREVLEALTYAHGAGIVHRDLKPSNVLLDPRRGCKIGDFGLALIAGGEFMQSIVQKSIAVAALEKTVKIGSSGRGTGGDAAALVGTLDYMAPEVRSGSGAVAASDLFALGIIAYRMLTGQVPRGMAKPPSRYVRGLPAWWDEWVEKMTEMDPAERFADAEAALSALGDAPEDGAEKARMELEDREAELRRAREQFERERREFEARKREAEAPKAAQKAVPPPAPQQKQAPQPAKKAERARVASAPSDSPEFGANWAVPSLGIEMLWINPGTFLMGSPKTEEGRNDNETQHQVTLTKGFWLGIYQVTQGQWEALMGGNPSYFKKGRVIEAHLFSADVIDNEDKSRHPVEQVSWNDAMEFCKKLTQLERAKGRLPAGCEYTLPTEAQWEYACRAGTTGPYGGNGSLPSMGWYDFNSGDTTHPVGQKQPNAWGLYDMHGNVWEWCSDWYGSYPSGNATDPAGASSGSGRVGRGGSWDSAASRCRSADRGCSAPSLRNDCLGFRLSLSSVR